MATIRQIAQLNPRDLEPDPHNARSDIGDLIGLAETIREHGVLQPLGVTRRGGGYRVVYGNRRREAAIVVGLDTVPCLVLDQQDDTERLLCQLLENLQRKSLNDMEQGRALWRLRDDLAKRSPQGTTERALNEAVAKQLGLSPRTIQRYVSLCELPPAVQELLQRDELTVTHAQHLFALTEDGRRAEVARLAAEEGLSAAELSRLCSGLAKNAELDPAEGLARLRRGQPVSNVQPESVAVAERLPRPPKAADAESDADLWPGEARAETEFAEPALAGPATADGNRRYRVRSLDSFLDELSRLVRCAEEGDLERFVQADPAGSTKVALALRQVGYLSRELGTLAKA
ncbi:MAG: ParB/RepB/Spo0J family partition protein [Chloroflexi bacterium]|nr:ParB/RepB/Spo0J family partition protein [Chloroflexota bacterium]MCL5108519.1 ParB/RepB/Spo0J family partition protein [Chloroflexota bacterium]